MSASAEDYYRSLISFMGAIRVTDSAGNTLPFQEGMHEATRLISSCVGAVRKVMFIGNGGSAAISSHMATDFWKRGRVRSVAFNDSALLTCIGNDYGYANVFEKPIEMFADSGDVLIAISSSGRSENILLGVAAARSRRCAVITLSGFDADNDLVSRGDLNFYVPASQYGPVEVIHHSICHCILDTMLHSGDP